MVQILVCRLTYMQYIGLGDAVCNGRNCIKLYNFYMDNANCHLSGNDIGHCNTLGLLAQIKLDLSCFHSVLPNTIFIFSEIIPRLLWSMSTELGYIEKICKRVIRTLMKFMPAINGFSF